jgi:hypothetical protein
VLDVECASAEAYNRGEDIVCGLGPPERLWIGVAGVDVGGDGGFQCLGGAVGTALDLLFGEESEEALDLIDPGRRCGCEVGMPARPFGEPVTD